MSDQVSLSINGVPYTCTPTTVVPAPTPTPLPIPVPTPPPGGHYPGPNLWGKRMNFSLSVGAPGVDGGFSIPAGSFYVEFPESGANVNIVLDGVMTSQDGRTMTGPSDHLLRVQLTSGAQSADGSIGVAHTP